MNSVALTNLGAVRKNNEDAIYANDQKQLYIVADGMGGYQGGEIASNMALQSIVADFEEFAGENSDEETLRENLRQAMYHANDCIYQSSQKGEHGSPMGTTLTVVYLRNDFAYIAHVGDSRAYLIRAGQGIKQITQDHSVAGEMLAKGEITAEEAKVHPQRHMLTRAIGYFPLVDVDITVFPLLKNDQLFLCTDGLYNLVSEEEIYHCVQSASEPIPRLIDMALEKGGFDNISAILITNGSGR